MGNTSSLADNSKEEEINAQRYLTSTQEESTRRSYEQLRYERAKLGRVKRKETENFGHEQEEYERKLREQEAKKLKLQDKRRKREVHDISNNVSYQNIDLESNRDVRPSVELEENKVSKNDSDIARRKDIITKTRLTRDHEINKKLEKFIYKQ
ncbi:hypothetical protein C1645_833183 [Glomus cerebriforme]|uniref:Uncharacterized protein n=1 Tax=Glomus cerebriforme TaxID=658196 RepID=A0A397SC31_9GLOM|nr:hypothetical protein C1645_833183 [Glomus cerebriforme]